MATKEKKLTLPIGDPQAGYAPSDVSFVDPDVELAGDEKEWAERRDQAREDLLDEIADNEDKVARQRLKDAEAATEEAVPKATSKSSGSGSATA